MIAYICAMILWLLKGVGFVLNILALISPRLVKILTFKLFCLPVAKKIDAQQAEYLNAAFLENLDLDGEDMAVYKWGSGNKVAALFHGWRSHSYRWKIFIKQLVERGYTVYAMDAPAHGNSGGKLVTLPKYSDAVDLVLEKYPADVVMAHSFGGLAVLYSFYRNISLRSSNLVLLASAGTVEDFINFFFTNARLSKRTQRFVNEYFVEMTGKLPKEFCVDEFVPGLDSRTLIVHDEKDPDVSVRHAYRIHELMPEHSELVITNGQGHNLKGHSVIKKVMAFILASP